MKNILSKLHKAVMAWTVLGLPFFIFCAGWAYKRGGESAGGGGMGPLNLLAFAWVLSMLYLIACLVLDRDLQERALAKLAGFRESDEREQLVTARAARSTFLLMLGLQIAMLAMTLTQVRVTMEPRTSPEQKTGTLSIGMRADSDNLTLGHGAAPKDESRYLWAWGDRMLPANLTLPLLLLLLAQLGCFRWFSGRAYEGGDE